MSTVSKSRNGSINILFINMELSSQRNIKALKVVDSQVQWEGMKGGKFATFH